MSLRVYTPPPRNNTSGALLGFAITCLAVPAAYAAAGYLLAGRGRVFWPPDRALEFAALCGSPLLLGGLTQWWDVWVRPAPKIGANWSPESPGHFLGSLFVYHAVAMAVAAFLLTSERPKPEVRGSLSEAFRINRAIRAAVISPGEVPLADEEIASLESRRDELYRAAVNGEVKDPNFAREKFGPSLFDLLVGVVIVIPSLTVPRRAGFTSGQPIQHS